MVINQQPSFPHPAFSTMHISKSLGQRLFACLSNHVVLLASWSKIIYIACRLLYKCVIVVWGRKINIFYYILFYSCAGSPATNSYYIAASHGEIYGLDHNIQRFQTLNMAKLRWGMKYFLFLFLPSRWKGLHIMRQEKSRVNTFVIK